MHKTQEFRYTQENQTRNSFIKHGLLFILLSFYFHENPTFKGYHMCIIVYSCQQTPNMYNILKISVNIHLCLMWIKEHSYASCFRHPIYIFSLNQDLPVFSLSPVIRLPSIEINLVHQGSYWRGQVFEGPFSRCTSRIWLRDLLLSCWRHWNTISATALWKVDSLLSLWSYEKWESQCQIASWVPIRLNTLLIFHSVAPVCNSLNWLLGQSWKKCHMPSSLNKESIICLNIACCYHPKSPARTHTTLLFMKGHTRKCYSNSGQGECGIKLQHAGLWKTSYRVVRAESPYYWSLGFCFHGDFTHSIDLCHFI